MRERDVVKYLKAEVKKIGGETRKVKWEGRKNAPDLLVMVPNCRLRWVELKAPGEVPTPGQKREHARLQGCDEIVGVLSSPATVDLFIESIKGKYVRKLFPPPGLKKL